MDLNISGDQSTLPDTQPLDDQNDPQSDPFDDPWQAWAHLVPSAPFQKSLALVKGQIFCSKIDEPAEGKCQVYKLNATDFPKQIFESFSRLHFTIFKISGSQESLDDFDAYITDFSSFGTFVNGALLGKGNTRPIFNDDTISLVKPHSGGLKFVCPKLTQADLKVPLPRSMRLEYILGKEISSGVSGKVCVAFKREKQGYRKLALKVIPKSNASVESVQVEVQILKKLNHPNIIRIEDFHATDKCFLISMELAAGGDLFNYVLHDYDHDCFDERVAKLQFYQILQGVKYMHGQKVCHRDLKLENILVGQKTRRGLLKIADFGLSKIVIGSTRLKTFVGSPNYVAPEVLRNEVNVKRTAYNFSADMWSLGCVLYSLFCGSAAFNGKNDEDLKTRIFAGEYNETHPGLKKISNDGKYLLSRLLQVDPSLRPSAKEALQFSWFSNDPTIEIEAKALIEKQIHSDIIQISHGLKNLKLLSKSPLPKSTLMTEARKRLAPANRDSTDDDDEDCNETRDAEPNPKAKRFSRIT